MTVTTEPCSISRRETFRLNRLATYAFLNLWVVYGVFVPLVLLALLVPSAWTFVAIYGACVLMVELVAILVTSKKQVDRNQRIRLTVFDSQFMVTTSQIGTESKLLLCDFESALVARGFLWLKEMPTVRTVIPIRAFKSDEDLKTALSLLKEAGVRVRG